MNDVQFRSPQWCPRRRPRPWPRAGRLGAVVFVVFAVVLGPVAAVAAAEPPAGEVVAGGASPAADTGAADVGEAALAAAGTGLVFTGPTRLSDSAAGVGTVGRRVEAEEIVRLAVVEADVWGRPTGVPAVAMAVVLEVTATEPAGPGFVRGWSCRGAAPATSVLNVAPGSPRANLAVVDLDGNGDVCLSSSVPMNLTADVVAWIPAGAAFDASTPGRAYDSRSDSPLQPGQPRSVELPGAERVVGGAGAAVVTVTSVGAGADGLLAVQPCRAGTDSASLPVVKGEALAATLILAVNDGPICVTASVATDVVIDVMAWYPKEAVVAASAARRLLDQPKQGSAPTGLHLDLSSVAAGATSGVFTVSSRDAAGPGLVLVHPCGQPLREAGSAPLSVKAAVATFVVPLSEAGVCLSATVDGAFAVDVRATLGPVAGGTPPYARPVSSALPAGRSTRARPFKASVVVGEQTPEAALAELAALAGAAWPGRYPQQEFGYLAAARLPEAVGRLRIGDSTGRAIGVCSATVVAANLVLTAAHCVLADDGQPYSAWEFQPGQFGPTNATGSWLTSKVFVDSGYRRGSPEFDYALLRFDEVRFGRTIGETVGWFPVGLDKAALGGPTVAIGYPIEGFFAGGCSGSACFPWFCAAPASNVASSPSLGGRSVGFGCVTAGGMSGASVFAQVDGQWAVVSLVSVGPRFDEVGLPCGGNNCYYGHNVSGPEFSAGAFDRLWDRARA